LGPAGLEPATLRFLLWKPSDSCFAETFVLRESFSEAGCSILANLILGGVPIELRAQSYLFKIKESENKNITKFN